MLPHLMYVAGYGFLLGTGKPEAPETGTKVTDGRPVFLIKGDSGVLGTGTVVDGEFWVCRGTRLKPRTRHFQKGDRAIYDALVSDGTIVLADEISPDTCRLWDEKTHEKLDKDRFRRDLGGVEDAYAEIMGRLLAHDAE